MSRKMTGLALVAAAALTLSACDWLTGKTATPPIANEVTANELTGNETGLGNSEEGFEDTVPAGEAGNAAGSALTNSSGAGNTM